MTITVGILAGMNYINGILHIQEILKMDREREKQNS